MRWAWCWLLIGLACQKPGSGDRERAPVTPGGVLVYEVQEGGGSAAVVYDVTLTFTPKGEDWDIALSSSNEREAPSTVRADGALVPTDNVIAAYSLGRLYLPTAGRAVGKRTPCGTVGPQRKYKQWEVWPVEGACGTTVGTRLYEASTGMLVGWLYSGAADEAAFLKDSR